MARIPNNANVLIIGGSGFVSGTLARVALGHRCRVWTVTRGLHAAPVGVVSLVADRNDDSALASAVREAGVHWDLVVDCIAFDVGDIRQDVELFRESADHLVFISTDFVFDPRKRVSPQPAESDYYLTDGYGGKKRQCELALANADTGSLRWTVLRPCHIYGPGSELGCLPLHGRDAGLIERLRAGEPLKLVGGGSYRQQPIFASDLAETTLSVIGNDRAHRYILQTAGPDIIESRYYYEVIAGLLGVEMRVEEVPADRYLSENADGAPFICDRVYDLSALADRGLSVPSTSIEDGLALHVESMLSESRCVKT